MRGGLYATRNVLPEHDLMELADLLAVRVYERLGQRAYLLGRQDIAELIASYTDDLVTADRRMLTWIVWDLLQEGQEIELIG